MSVTVLRCEFFSVLPVKLHVKCASSLHTHLSKCQTFLQQWYLVVLAPTLPSLVFPAGRISRPRSIPLLPPALDKTLTGVFTETLYPTSVALKSVTTIAALRRCCGGSSAVHRERCCKTDKGRKEPCAVFLAAKQEPNVTQFILHQKS